MRKILGEVIRISRDPLFLVGGPVRDLLLRRKILDLDFAVEGDAVKLARHLAEAQHGKMTVHPRFHTAKVVFPCGTTVDIAQTRRERYPEAARLPVVEPGATIEDDLARRDFGIQAMALKLNGHGAGRIIDPFDGRRDLKNLMIRILHPASFRDDPVRAFRAIRYAGRYHFHIEKNTQKALHDLRKNSGLLCIASDRILDEWRRTFEEERWVEIVRSLCKQKLLVWLDIGPATKVRNLQKVDGSFRNLSRFFENSPELWVVRWISFLTGCPRPARFQIASLLPFPRQIKKLFFEAIDTDRVLKQLSSHAINPSRVVEVLSKLPPEWLIVLNSKAGARAGNHIKAFLTKWRHISPPATGDDLRRWGVPPGPAYPEILRKLHAAKLDGRLRGPKDIERIVSAGIVMK